MNCNSEDTLFVELTPTQRGVYFDQMRRPGNPCYNLGLICEIFGSVDAALLQKSFDDALSRLPERLGRLVYRNAASEVESSEAGRGLLEVSDLTGRSPGDALTTARRNIEHSMDTYMDIDKDVLLKSALFKISAETALWFIQAHHILSDVAGLRNLLDAVVARYNVLQKSNQECSADVSEHYDSHATMRTDDIASAQDSQRFWRKELSQCLNIAVSVNWNRSESDGPSNVATRRISHELKQRVESRGMVLRHVVRAALALYCTRTMPAEEVVLGLVLHGRREQELGSALGMHARVLPARISIGKDMRIGQLLDQLAAKARAIYHYQNYDGAEMARDAGLLQAGRTQLADISFNYIDLGSRVRLGAAVGSLSLASKRYTHGTIEVRLYDFGDGIEPEMLVYCPRAHRLETAPEILLEQLHHLVEQIAHAEPSAQCASLEWIPARERHETSELAKTSLTSAMFRPEAQRYKSSIIALLEAQVRRQPDAVALVSATGAITTYGELNARVNRLARYMLQRQLAGPGDKVGLYLQRSPEAIIAMLAVLKVGSAYVPLDPTYPLSRIVHMIDDAKPTLCICDGSSPPAANNNVLRTLCQSAHAQEIAACAAENLELEVSGQQTAYVIYTSGSTGVPKGIAIPHEGVVRLVYKTDYIQLEPGCSVAQASTVSFDAATFEIFGALLNGGRLVVIANDVLLMPDRLAECLAEQRIDALFLTTALFNQVVRELPRAFDSVGTLMFGGEFADPSSVRTLLNGGGPERLLHVYGPTENTTFSTWYNVVRIPDDAINLPIGKPISGTDIHVLDNLGRPVLPGAQGEIHIGGTGLAHGYIGAADLTAERFVPHPFSSAPGERLYRTGDIVRLLDSGDIEFLGRIDHQVKIRGFRIELGEIEAFLCRHPDVKQAVVVVRSSDTGSRNLVAYVVPAAAGRGTSIDDLRVDLKRSLPEYMVPTQFVVLDRLPLNRNGKVDKQALPLPTEFDDNTTAWAVCGGDVETRLLRIWVNILGAGSAKTRENFFEAGGTSLMLMSLRSAIKKEWPAVEIGISEMFKYPSVAGLARHIREVLGVRAVQADEEQIRLSDETSKRRRAFLRQKRQAMERETS